VDAPDISGGNMLRARSATSARAALWVGLVLSFANAVAAQDRHTLAGSVVDSSGAVIAGADVRVTDARGASSRTVTDARGEFRVMELPAGDYIVQVERKQFARAVSNAHLGAGSETDVRIVLRPEGVSERVTVVGRDAPYAEPETTTATKIATSRREVPSSVSVLTREQMNDQQMVNTWDALSQITGVTAISNDSTQSQYHARGAALESQQDGIPSAQPLSGYQQYDLAIYERVEVLRGPAGLLQGSGAFSGTVNFVRRRPTATRTASAQASIGSWNNGHVEADLSVPLTASLRSLAIVEATDRDYFYERGHDRRWLGYGMLEWTPRAATVLGFTAIHQRDRSPSYSGLPAYPDGRFLNVDRSFNPYPDWNRYAWDTTDVGADVDHRFNAAWRLVARVNRRTQSFLFHDGFTFNAVNPATQTTDYARRESNFDYTSNSVDAYVDGRFTAFAIGHEWVIGLNASRFESQGRGVDQNSDPSLLLRNVVVADPPIVPEPSFTYRTGSESVTSQSGLYTLLRSRLGGGVSTVLGGRWTNFSARSHSVAPSKPTDWVPGATADMKFTPYAGAVVDASREVSLYASYSSIFVPQTQKRADGTVLDPRVGHQWEFGAKGEHLSKRLLTSLAVFDIRDRNRAYLDPSNPGFFVPLGEVESKGWEAEVTGRVAPPWDLSAGYTWLDTQYLVNETRNGQPLNYLYPKHSLKAWSTWRISRGQVKNLRIGAGVQAYSRSSNGTDTVNAAGVITVAARRQSAYAVVGANLSYPIQRHLQLALQVNNLFDRTYFTRLGGSNIYNTYGEPRSAMVSLHWQSMAQ
jgi:outer membrane receptor for ferric coprogen and ferric-rhodotorulic acid